MAIRFVSGGVALLAALSFVVANASADSAPAGRIKVLHAFTGAPDGDLPFAGALVFDGAGNLYGTTPLGGTGSCKWRDNLIGCGTVFELSPAAGAGWTEHILYNFKNFADGMQPYGTVTLGAGGHVYGVTTAGGVRGQGCVPPFFGLRGCGTAFELTPHPSGAWTKQTLHVFSGGKDGGLPESNLVTDAAGNLYGSLYCGGGIDSCYGEDDVGGAFFKLTRAQTGGWREQILHAFTVQAGDGCCPLGSLTVDHRRGDLWDDSIQRLYDDAAPALVALDGAHTLPIRPLRGRMVSARRSGNRRHRQRVWNDLRWRQRLMPPRGLRGGLRVDTLSIGWDVERGGNSYVFGRRGRRAAVHGRLGNR